MKKLFLLFAFFVSTRMYAQYFNLKFATNDEPAIFGPGVISDGLANRDKQLPPPATSCFIHYNMARNLTPFYIVKK